MDNTPSPIYKPSRTTEYCDPKGALDFVLLSVHGDNGDRFIETFPEFMALCHLTRGQMRTLMASEADFGATELAHTTAFYLAKEGFRAAVFEALLPREIVDCNRVAEEAIKPVWDWKKHPAWKEEWTRLYRQTMAEKEAALCRLSPRGIFLDIHTMRHFDIVSPVPPPRPNNPGIMREHLEARLITLQTDRNIRSRVACLPTRVESADGQMGEGIADPIFLDRLTWLLREHNIPFRENHPYPLNDFVAGTQDLKIHRGAAIDWVKSDLTRQKWDGPDPYDLANLALNWESIQGVASIQGEALKASIG